VVFILLIELQPKLKQKITQTSRIGPIDKLN
jgi:hypothetical protein